jgi:hypothetical protein
MEALKVIVKQFAKNVEELPGWIPLLVASYLVLAFLGVREEFEVLHRPLKVPAEVFATVGTLVLYLAGDAIDKGAFNRIDRSFLKRWFPDWLEKTREDARDALGVQEGIYSVSKLLAVAAGHYQRLSIQVANEAAKFLRSISLPLLIIGVWWYCCKSSHARIGMLIAAFGIITFPAYVYLKALHMRKLYLWASHLPEKLEYQTQDLADLRLFFWEGELVASAMIRY